MIEALQEELAAKSSQLLLYLQCGELRSILRDTTTRPSTRGDRLVFLPAAVYPNLITRFKQVRGYEFERVAQYLAERSSDEFLLAIEHIAPEILDDSLSITPEPEDQQVAVSFAVRLRAVRAGTLLNERRRLNLSEALETAICEHGWLGFLDVPDVEAILPEFSVSVLRREVGHRFRSVHDLREWYSGDLSSKDLVLGAIEAIDGHCARLANALTRQKLMSDEAAIVLEIARKACKSPLEEKVGEFEEAEDRRAESMQDEWRERQDDERLAIENGPFADVDE